MRPNRKEYIVKDEPSPCPECPCFATCSKLCDRAERWVDQDTVGSNSNVLLENGGNDGKVLFDIGGDFVDFVASTNDVVSRRDTTGSQEAWEEISGMRLTERVSRFIYSYYMLGKRIRDIAIDEGATSQAIDRRHQQAKMSVKNRLDRERRWVDGRDRLEFRSIRHYDMASLFFGYFYPRRVVSTIVGVNASTVIKEISRHNNVLQDKSD